MAHLINNPDGSYTSVGDDGQPYTTFDPVKGIVYEHATGRTGRIVNTGSILGGVVYDDPSTVPTTGRGE